LLVHNGRQPLPLPLLQCFPAFRLSGIAALRATGLLRFAPQHFSSFYPPRFPHSIQGEKLMHIVTNVGPLAALIAGILILVVPRLLNFIVALYLIIIGLLGLFGDHIR
jgi:Protein of unknown function (DUF3096)